MALTEKAKQEYKEAPFRHDTGAVRVAGELRGLAYSFGMEVRCK